MSVRSQAEPSHHAFFADVVRLAILAEGTPLGNRLADLVRAIASRPVEGEWRRSLDALDEVLANAAADALLPLETDEFEVHVFKAAAVLSALNQSWIPRGRRVPEVFHLRAGWAAATPGFVRLAVPGVQYVAHTDHVLLEMDRHPRVVIRAIGRDARRRAAVADWPRLTARWDAEKSIRLMVAPWPHALREAPSEARCMLHSTGSAARGASRGGAILPVEGSYDHAAGPALVLKLSSPESVILAGAAAASSAWLEVRGSSFGLLMPLPELGAEEEVVEVYAAYAIVDGGCLSIGNPLRVELPPDTADELMAEAALQYKIMLTTRAEPLAHAIMRKAFKTGDTS